MKHHPIVSKVDSITSMTGKAIRVACADCGIVDIADEAGPSGHSKSVAMDSHNRRHAVAGRL